IDDDVSHSIRAWWTKLRAALGVLCDWRIPLKLKGKFYKVAIRPAMLYGSKCWPITKAQATRVEVAELRMLRWICGKTMIDMKPNGVFRAELDVDSIVDKMREGMLRWFGYVNRRPRNAPVRRVKAMEVEGSRPRGRPKLRWEDILKMNMKELLLSEDMTSDRNAWRDRIRISVSLVPFVCLVLARLLGLLMLLIALLPWRCFFFYLKHQSLCTRTLAGGLPEAVSLLSGYLGTRSRICLHFTSLISCSGGIGYVVVVLPLMDVRLQNSIPKANKILMIDL
nr:polyprotein, putative [Tanacetum cinerariifolium]